MDSLTHALIAAILAYALGFPQLLPFVVLGAVIIDADILFSLLSRHHPSLYLFIHGGIAHSFAGAVVMAVLAYAGIALVTLTGFISPAQSWAPGRRLCGCAGRCIPAPRYGPPGNPRHPASCPVI